MTDSSKGKTGNTFAIILFIVIFVPTDYVIYMPNIDIKYPFLSSCKKDYLNFKEETERFKK